MVKLELRVISHTTDGKKWLSYKALSKSNKWVDLKFAQSVIQVPQHPCIILVENEQMFQENPDRVKFPKVVVKAIAETRALLVDRPVEDYDKIKTAPKAEELFNSEE